jgi:hypothetical protein
MEWLNWTSPVGASVVIVSVSFAFYLFSQSVYTLTRTGKEGKEMENTH